MPHGRQSKSLTPEEIARLDKYRRSKRWSFPELNQAMCSPFKWRTIARALEGQPVWEVNHDYIVAWIDRWCPALPASHTTPVVDGKLAAAGKDA